MRAFCRVKDESGEWVRNPTPFAMGDERKARRCADAAQAAMDALAPRDRDLFAQLRESGALAPRTRAKHLAAWKLSGWERTYGRRPEPDLIVPTRNLTERKRDEAQEGLIYDLGLLGLRTRAGSRARRGHNLRRTFITLAQVDGARRDLLEAVAHGHRARAWHSA